MNIEETSILEDMNKVQDLMKEILNENERSRNYLDKQKSKNVLDSLEYLDIREADGHTADDAKNVKRTSDEKESEEKPKKVKKHRTNHKVDENVFTSHKKTPSLIKQVDEALSHAQRDLDTSISNQKQIGLNTAGILDEVAELMAEGAEVLV